MNCGSAKLWLGLGIGIDCTVENSSSPFIFISSSQRSIALLALLLFLLKIACLHVSFTAYENFYKLSKMQCLLVCFPLTFHQKYQKTEIPQSNIYPLIHCFFTFVEI